MSFKILVTLCAQIYFVMKLQYINKYECAKIVFLWLYSWLAKF